MKTILERDKTIFTQGKYKGKTWKEVRIKYPDYLLCLATQPLGNTINHFDFITYCMDVLRFEFKQPVMDYRRASP